MSIKWLISTYAHSYEYRLFLNTCHFSEAFNEILEVKFLLPNACVLNDPLELAITCYSLFLQTSYLVNSLICFMWNVLLTMEKLQSENTQYSIFPCSTTHSVCIQLLSLVETKHWLGSCENCILLLIVTDSLIKLGVVVKVRWVVQCRWFA